MVDKFEVGDKVRIVKLDVTSELYVTDIMKENLGNYGIVTMRVRDDITTVDGAVYVKLENGFKYFCMPEWLELVEKAKNPWNGKVVCVDSHSNFFTKGKIYEVKNGYLYDDSKTPYLAGNRYYVCPKHTLTYSADFIEFKGFANE